MKKMSESGTRPILVRADVSDEDDVAQMFDLVLGEYGRLDYLINTAGIQIAADTQDLEFAARGVRVNGIGPGATVTPINRSWIEDPTKRAMVESHIPMRRAGDAEEMAGATAFLCSDEAAYITGQTLFIDGGLTLYPLFETTWSSE
jgi:glucose 1-dehydrogenase